jgi:hypothetical protein
MSSEHNLKSTLLESYRKLKLENEKLSSKISEMEKKLDEIKQVCSPFIKLFDYRNKYSEYAEDKRNYFNFSSKVHLAGLFLSFLKFINVFFLSKFSVQFSVVKITDLKKDEMNNPDFEFEIETDLKSEKKLSVSKALELKDTIGLSDENYFKMRKQDDLKLFLPSGYSVKKYRAELRKMVKKFEVGNGEFYDIETVIASKLFEFLNGNNSFDNEIIIKLSADATNVGRTN